MRRWLALLSIWMAIPAAAECFTSGPMPTIGWEPVRDTLGHSVSVTQYEIVLRSDAGALSSFTVPGTKTQAQFRAPSGTFTAQLFAYLASGKVVSADPTEIHRLCMAGDLDCDGTSVPTKRDHEAFVGAYRLGCRIPQATP